MDNTIYCTKSYIHLYPGKYESRMDIRAENLVYSQYIFVFEFNYLYYLYTIYLYEVKHSKWSFVTTTSFSFTNKYRVRTIMNDLSLHISTHTLFFHLEVPCKSSGRHIIYSLHSAFIITPTR